jgi:hypothetical protein
MNILQIAFGGVAVYLLIGMVFATWMFSLKPEGEQAPMSWSGVVLKWPPIAAVALIGIALVRGFRKTDTVEVRD